MNILQKEKDDIKEIILNQYLDQPITIDETIKNDYFVSTLSKVNINKKDIGFILEVPRMINTNIRDKGIFFCRQLCGVSTHLKQQKATYE